MYAIARVGTWNFQALCSDSKALEIGEILTKNHIDIIGDQESWELESSKILVSGYKWIGKPREGIKNKRWEGGVGFLVSESLLDNVTIIEKLNAMKPYGWELGLELAYIYTSDVLIYSPQAMWSIHNCICTDRFNLLEEDICVLQSKGESCFWEILMLGLVKVMLEMM